MNEFAKSDDGVSATLSDAVRQHPLPAALIGMGLIWLMSGKTARQQAGKIVEQTGASRIPDLAADAADKSRRALQSGYDAISEAVSDARASLEQDGGAIVDRASNAVVTSATSVKQAVTQLQDNLEAARTFDNTKAKVTELLERQPLLLGVVGLAVGAGLAAAMPPTQLEKELLGDASESFMRKARDLSSEHLGQAGQIASSFVESAKDEAKAQFEGALKDG